MRRDGLRLWALVLAAHAATTIAVALSDDVASPWRHAYLVPVIGAALAFGPAGGVAGALAGVLFYAPIVLPGIERAGLTAAAVESGLTVVALVAAGGLAGTLAEAARRHRGRYAMLLAVQRALAEDAPLEIALGRLRACLEMRLGPGALAVVARDGDRCVIAGGDTIAAGSATAVVLEHGEPVFVASVAVEGPPRRAFVAPISAGDGVVGALALERDGDIGAGERAALLTLGAHVGLALENARLASRQRRFAADLQARVAEATRMKSEFVAIASHELRTPLTAIQGFSELLATRPFSADEARRIAGVIRGESERLGRIVSDFLDLSRIERGLEPALRRAPVDVAVAVTAALDIFRWSRLGQRIDLECGGELPAVSADADALDRIVKNLVSNALKYSPPDSRVRVRARATAAGVEISVDDEGGGIPAGELARIFEPYYRAPGAAAAARGAGIGLAVVKALVEAHGGCIRADSEPARGTRMSVVLPALP
ncbi:MAG TPA: ATP-binding protein [Candidatus Limnocylindria bacterium]|nr:ATP-binding protein [Candidatus Limnocylindria bacterium]